jgi:hypothetical protein
MDHALLRRPLVLDIGEAERSQVAEPSEAGAAFTMTFDQGSV